MFRVTLKHFQKFILLAVIALVGVGMTVALLAVNQVRAESTIFFDFYMSGDSPNAYGVRRETEGDWDYVYGFQASSDDQNISSIEYEIDSEGRVDLSASSILGAFDSTLEEVIVYVDQRPYADGLDHSITFYVTTAALEESSYVLPLEPVPDTDLPVITTYVSQTSYVQDDTLPFSFEVTDDFIADVTFDLDGTGIGPEPDTYSWAQRFYEFNLSSLETPGIDPLDGNSHTLTIEATDIYGNVSNDEFTFIYGEDPEADTDDPVFAFSVQDSGLSNLPLTYTGTIDDASTISWYAFRIDSEEFGIAVDEETSTDTHKVFTVEISDLSNGAHTISFLAEDIHGNLATSTFNVDVDGTAPSCTSSWVNLPSPHYSEQLSYPNITCTDDREIVQAAYEVYHVVHDTLLEFDDHPLTPQDGVFDEASETFDLNVDLSAFDAIDGVVNVTIKVWDEAGNAGTDFDPVTIDFDDNTPPVVNLDEITPDPLTDKTPTIVGSCRDMTDRETNSYISNLEYKIDAGAYQSISLLDSGVYNDAYTEAFSTEIPELANGTYTITVRCTDQAGLQATTSDTVTIADPSDPSPGEFTYTEQFEGYDNQDIPASNDVIWGNGKLRLKEDITLTRTLVNGDDACPRYGDCRGLWNVYQDPQDSDLLWYYMNNKIFTYNVATDTNTQFNYTSTYSLPAMGGELNGFALGVFEGKKYLWMSDIYGLYVINLTDGVGVYEGDYDNVGSINLDFDRDRFAAYTIITATGGYANMAYIDLNDMTNAGDNVITRTPYAHLGSDVVVGILTDPTTNAVYTGLYSSNRVYKFNDQNTPHNTADDVITYYANDNYSSVFGGMTLDPEGKFIFGTANNSNGRLFVVEDDGGTAFDASDDTVIQLANPLQLGYRNVYGIEYIVGQNGVGDQLLLTTEGNIPVYVNFNSTYSNPYDDTFIELDTQANTRPGGSSPLMYDYDTMYVVSKTQGFYKVELHRGWKDSGEAVAIPTRPPEQLVIDNFVAEANVGGVIANGREENPSFLAELQNTFIPQTYAAPGDAIRYYVSTDGGITWTEVTLGQLQQLQQTDYRVKFKIELSEVDGSTPVLNSYSLAYAGYPDEEQATTAVGMTVTPSVTSIATNGTFSLTAQVVDTLGFPTPSYSSTATVSLIDSTTNNPVSALNVSSLNITSGTATATGVQISQVGSFKIRVTDGTYTQDSGVITVSQGSNLTSPSLNFWSTTYKIKKGESATLEWSSSNLSSFTINPGNHQYASTAGTLGVSPSETTEYTLSADGSYGSLTSRLTIVVEGEVAASPSPSPSPTARTRYRSSGLDANEEQSTESAVVSGISPDDRISDDQTIIRGQKASIFWDFPDADEVTIDYPVRKEVGRSGSFEFFPYETTVVTLRIVRGGEVTERKITITVVNAPLSIQQLARNIQQTLPWATPILSRTVIGVQRLPGMVLATSVVAQLAVVGLLSASIASQGSLWALFNLKTAGNVLSVAGLLPAKKRKGFVHQTKTGLPVPFSTISVSNGAGSTNETVITLVSDMYGAYIEPYLPKGSYVFTAAHPTFTFPTQTGRPAHLSVRDFYKGEMVAVASNKEKTALLIPMDTKTAATVKQAWRHLLLLRLTRLLHSLQWTLYPLLGLSLVAVWLSPTLWSALIAVIYLIVVGRHFLQTLKKPSLKGQIVNRNGRPVSYATIILTTEDGNAIAIDKSNQKGRFEFYVPEGKYAVNVIATNLIWDEAKVGSNVLIDVRGSKTASINIVMSELKNPFVDGQMKPIVT